MLGATKLFKAPSTCLILREYITKTVVYAISPCLEGNTVELFCRKTRKLEQLLETMKLKGCVLPYWEFGTLSLLVQKAEFQHIY